MKRPAAHQASAMKRPAARQDSAMKRLPANQASTKKRPAAHQVSEAAAPVQLAHQVSEAAAPVQLAKISVTLASGRSHTFEVEDSITAGELRELAQEHFNTSFLRLVTADGGMVDPTQPVCPLGPDSTGIVIQPTMAATEGALAIFWPGSGVISWGMHNEGGDSSAVQAQLKNVQTIAAGWYAFAAILADGSVVTWGNLTRVVTTLRSKTS